MIERLGLSIFLCTLTVSQPKGDDQISLTMVKPGNNFSMTCSIDRTDAGLIYWYRMRFETIFQTIAEGTYDKITLYENFSHRFNVTKVNTNLYSLNIFNVTKDDEASYFCQAGSSYKMSFFNTTFLMVLDDRNHTVRVDQNSSVSAPLGESVQLNCSLLSTRDCSVQCPSKRSVHWFRSGSETSPARMIYTYKDQRDEQDQRKCVYTMDITLQGLNDTGMYYCAVATCGEILFGKGTRVEISPSSDLRSVCVALGILLICSAAINAVMFYQYRKTTHCKGIMTTNNSIEVLDRIENRSSSAGSNVAGVNYVALDFPLRKVKRKKKKKKNGLPPECFYSKTWDNR